MKQLLIIGVIFCFGIKTSNGQTNSDLLRLDFITEIPSVIDGCSGLYTYDTTSISKKKYIIVSDLQEIAFIKIKGKEIKLQSTSKKQLSNLVYRSTYKGDGYSVTITTKTAKKTGEESSIEIGTVEITKGAQKIVIKIHGESGC